MSLSGLFALSKTKKPKAPAQSPPPPPPPTIDEAAMNEEASRKYRRRRGIRANITGAGGETASVASKQLLG